MKSSLFDCLVNSTAIHASAKSRQLVQPQLYNWLSGSCVLMLFLNVVVSHRDFCASFPVFPSNYHPSTVWVCNMALSLFVEKNRFREVVSSLFWKGLVSLYIQSLVAPASQNSSLLSLSPLHEVSFPAKGRRDFLSPSTQSLHSLK